VGSRFDVVFDAVSGKVRDSEKRRSPPSGLGDQTVLVVEDEPMVRGLVQRQLEGAGLSVLVAEDAEDALHVADDFEGEIHGMVSDVIMPGVNGVELAEMMAERREGIGVLLMSGYTDRVPVKKDAAAAGFRLLNKPFSKDDLLTALREVLEGSSQSAA
jgi:DNA-binding NtrC family response regulator